jgi:CubicO group peptidase (beta-lactamase class C family)
MGALSGRRSWLVLALAACASPQTPPARPAGEAPSAAAPALAQRHAVQPPSPPALPERRAKLAELVPELDQLFSQELTRRHLPGLGVGIVLDGELVYARGFGFRDLAAKAPFDADTVFRIASVTKSFTAMAVLKLRDEGRLSLDVPAATYYPPLAELAYPTRDSPLLTVRQLLTHGSGLPEDNYWVDTSSEMTEAELQALVESGMSFSRAPDTHFEYSNVGYALLGRVIAQVSGMPAREYIRRALLLPLGMTASGWEVDEVSREQLAIGYRGDDGYRGKDAKQLPAPLLNLGALDVAGGLYTTVRDMGRYLAFLLSAWPPRDDAEVGPVRRSTLREMQQGMRRSDADGYLSALLSRKPQPVAQATEEEFHLSASSYGGGLGISTTCAEDFLVTHSGGLPGYSTFLGLLPEKGFGFIYLVNDERVAGPPYPELLALLRKAGLLERRGVTPVPALVDARSAVDSLLEAWAPDAAQQLFEATFFSYQSVEKLGEQFAALQKAHGSCRPEGPLEAQTWLRGRWRLHCERGAITFAAALSPRAHPRLQALLWESELPPSPLLREAAATLARLLGRWDEATAKALFAVAVDRPRAEKGLARLAAEAGQCTVGRPLRGDGVRQGEFELLCSEGALQLFIALEEPGGRVASWRGYRPRAADSPYCAR